MAHATKAHTKAMHHHHLAHEEEMKGGKHSHHHHHPEHHHEHHKGHKMVDNEHRMAVRAKIASVGDVGHQTKADRMDESLGMRRGRESTKMQSMESRRHESRGARGK